MGDLLLTPRWRSAGYSEEAAKEAGFDVVTSKHRSGGNGRALIVGEPDGLVKIIAEKGADGSGRHASSACTWSGRGSPSSSGQGYLAVNWEATVDEVAHFIQPHPTLSELFGESVLAHDREGACTADG